MKLNATLITIALALIGWLVSAVWIVSRLNAIQEYQERMLTKIEARIDMHIDQQEGPPRPRQE